MSCRGYTLKGSPCQNRASSNGYCHLHGGIPTRKASRIQAQRAYDNSSPEEQAELDGFSTVIWIIVIVLMVLFGLVTGDWEGVLKWASH